MKTWQKVATKYSTTASVDKKEQKKERKLVQSNPQKSETAPSTHKFWLPRLQYVLISRNKYTKQMNSLLFLKRIKWPSGMSGLEAAS